jgi:Ni/Co efflux regulator RcnB
MLPEGEITMFKRIGTLTLMLAAAGAAALPTTAFAEDRYHASRDNYYHSDRDKDRHDTRQWRKQERRGERWRASERRESDHRFNRYDGNSYRPAYLIRIANDNFASGDTTLFRAPTGGSIA